MKILIVGDVFAKPGRRTLEKYLPIARERLKPDVVVVNGENAAHGYGIRPNMVHWMLNLGVDVITSGNHIWDHKDIVATISDEPRLLRPMNYPRIQPGRGVFDLVLRDPAGGKESCIRVINIAGRIAMGPAECPFQAVDEWVGQGTPASQGFAAIVVDFHAEATSEKNAMGFHLDGRCTAVVGTHTHIPTADHRILPLGSGYVSDLGMTGNYRSIIGVSVRHGIDRFLGRLPRQRPEPALGDGMFCAALVSADRQTGLCVSMDPIRIGKGLSECLPHGIDSHPWTTAMHYGK